MVKLQFNDVKTKLPPFVLENIHPLSVFLIFCIISILDIYYVFRDTLPPSWDQSLHMQLSLIYYNLIKSGMFSEIAKVSNYYPPFFHLSGTPMYAFFGTSEDVARLSNLIYLFILLFSTYGIGRILFNKNTGVLATAIIAMYPILIRIQRDYLIDFALTSVIALTIYFLLKTEGFTKMNYSIAFGLSWGAAELMKWPAVFFIVGPVMYIFYQMYNDKKCPVCGSEKTSIRDGFRYFCSTKHMDKYSKTKKNVGYSKVILNIAIAVIIAFSMAGWWYFPNFDQVYKNLMEQQTVNAVAEGNPEVLTFDSLKLYVLTIFQDQIFLFFGILFVAGIIYLYFNKKSTNQKLFLFLSIFIPYIVFTLTRLKNTRYTLPLVIFFAIISAFWIININSKKSRTAILLILFIIGSLQLSTMTFGTPDLHPSGEWTFWMYPPADKPNSDDWKVGETLNAIKESLPQRLTQRPVVIIMSDHHFINGRTFSYYAYKRGDPIEVINGAYLPFDIFKENINNIPYLIYKTNVDVDMKGSSYEVPVKNMYSLFEENKDKYQQLDKSFTLPDGSTLYIYRNKMLG